MPYQKTLEEKIYILGYRELWHEKGGPLSHKIIYVSVIAKNIFQAAEKLKLEVEQKYYNAKYYVPFTMHRVLPVELPIDAPWWYKPACGWEKLRDADIIWELEEVPKEAKFESWQVPEPLVAKLKSKKKKNKKQRVLN